MQARVGRETPPARSTHPPPRPEPPRDRLRRHPRSLQPLVPGRQADSCTRRMTHSPRMLTTRRGQVRLPTYIPVTPFGDTYPLDRLLTPYLPRLAQAIMVSFHYARQMEEVPRLPLFVDSGGFASLFSDARLVGAGELGLLEITRENAVETIH